MSRSSVRIDIAFPDDTTVVHVSAPKDTPTRVVIMAILEAALECARLGKRLTEAGDAK